MSQKRTIPHFFKGLQVTVLQYFKLNLKIQFKYNYTMKNILNLAGIQKLNKEEQSKIRGAIFSGCCSSNKCRVSFPGGEFCEPGRCTNFGCIFY